MIRECAICKITAVLLVSPPGEDMLCIACLFKHRPTVAEQLVTHVQAEERRRLRREAQDRMRLHRRGTQA